MEEAYRLECAVWEFTLACNLRCLHCGASAGRKRTDELTTEEAVRLCHDLKAAGCLGVALMGGEPLLREDFFHIAHLIRDLGMDLSVITNGTVALPGLMEKLLALTPRAVAVSLDGSAPETHDHIRGKAGAFEKTWQFVDQASQAGLPVSVITTVHRLNLRELPAMRARLLGKRIAWQIQVAGAEGRRFPPDLLLDEEEFYSVGLFISATRKKYSVREMPLIGAHDLGYHSLVLGNLSLVPDWPGCQAGRTVIGIQSNGNVKGCLAIDDSATEGNVRDISIRDLWLKEGSFAYTRGFAPSDAGENCRECAYVDTCRGGCNEMSLMKTGRFHNDPYCFRRIEERIFAKELRNPVTRLMMKARCRLNAIRTGKESARLANIFQGYRK